MPVSGVVVTLSDRPEAAPAFASACAGEDRVVLGERSEDRWPLVLDTRHPREAEWLHHWLLSLPVVQSADVVYVAFDEETPCSDTPSTLSTEPRP